MQSPNSHPSQQLLGSLPTPQPGSKPLGACLWDQKPSSESPGPPKCRFLDPPRTAKQKPLGRGLGLCILKSPPVPTGDWCIVGVSAQGWVPQQAAEGLDFCLRHGALARGMASLTCVPICTTGTRVPRHQVVVRIKRGPMKDAVRTYEE